MRKDAKMEENENWHAFDGLSFFTDASGLTRHYKYVRINYSANRTNRPHSFCLTQSLGEKAALLFSVAEMQPVSVENTKVG
jgi:hypothetical protein